MTKIVAKARTKSQGYKTYAVAAALLAVVVVEQVLGVDVPGVDLGDDWLLVVLNAAGLGTLRAGVSVGTSTAKAAVLDAAKDAAVSAAVSTALDRVFDRMGR